MIPHHGDVSGDTLRDRASAAQQRKAGINTAAAALAGGWTREHLLTVLQAIGIAPTPSGGLYDPTGKHITCTDRLTPAAPRRPRTPPQKLIADSDWDTYDRCHTCGRDPGDRCRALKGGRGLFWPHTGRKRT